MSCVHVAANSVNKTQIHLRVYANDMLFIHFIYRWAKKKEQLKGPENKKTRNKIET